MEEKLKEKLTKLLEKAERKLKAAEKLYESKMYEDALSRAYYAMYHAAIGLLLTKDISPKTHSGMLTMLAQHFVKSGEMPEEYFQMISKGKELRENGDYELLYEGTSEEAKVVINDARKFIEEAREILNL